MGEGGKTRLVAERCFNLSEIVVVDLKDGGGELSQYSFASELLTDSLATLTDLSNAIKIKRGKETIIFRTERPDDKKAMLLAFKKVAEELSNKRRKDMLTEAEARKGDVRSLAPSHLYSTLLTIPLSLDTSSTRLWSASSTRF